MTPPDWRIDYDARPDLRAMLQAAVGEIGACEDPPHSNRGSRVDLYTGGRAIKWCVAFCRWSYTQAGLAFPHTDSVADLAEWGRANGRLVHSGRLMPGDVGCILGEGPTGDEHHHAVLVVADLGDGRAACVEGNHGDRVAATVRSGAEFAAIVRVG